MKLTRLRIVGFKSFVEPAEFLIEPGLTGVVGPNGCGKSNLVEALRWVMGESSTKNMRASGMDDVIFAGSGGRPARNTAEVALTVDNADRTAPAAFNADDTLEIARRIEREEGSTYRINGREVRARDVQLLFADAATGARSAALVRQGQISEIINAKPQARRRILEDAAGIAGLHARRHEAELRLKAAEDNLLRVEDVLRELETQVESLRRQSRQAARYKALAAEIRMLEAALLLIGYREARDAVAAGEAAERDALAAVAERTRAQAQAATVQAVAAHALPALREGEAAAAAALQRLLLARTELDAEERRSKERLTDLEGRVADLEGDLARQTAAQADAAATIARLKGEAADLAAAGPGTGEATARAQARAAEAEAALAAAEGAFSARQAKSADLNARRGALERTRREEAERAMRFSAERERIGRDLAALDAPSGGQTLEALRAALHAAEAAQRAADDTASGARAALAAAREAEGRDRSALNDAERGAQRLETEARTLAKLFAPAADDLWPPVLDALTVEKGYETALGAALGEDLDASINVEAPTHWAPTGPGPDDPALPEGVPSLAERVEAPPALRRRLAQIGVVSRAEGPRLRQALKPGQRLVSREGDLWRWDGYATAADAPSAAARRLAERNRLGDLQREAAAARAEAEHRRGAFERAQGAVRAAAQAEAAALEAAKAARRALDGARERAQAAERREAELAARRSAQGEALARLSANEAEAREREAAALAALGALQPAPDLEARLLEARADVAERRAAASEARAALQSLIREAELAERRRAALDADIRTWTERAARAVAAAGELDGRLARVRIERKALLEAPDTYLIRRRGLIAGLEEAEVRRKEAADRLALGERDLAEGDRTAREALDALGTAREALAAAKARLEALRQRLDDIVRSIADHLDTTPAGLAALAGLREGQAPPPLDQVEARLAALKGDRERLGAVNLRAEDELAALSGKRDTLVAERDDLAEAIKRLRQAVSSLNREGRERLLAAFAVVNGHFQRLFTTLFGGGTADLTLIDADDPLDAGLDILARPPGKKPQTMTLLSGGEQALTATALIFAVFLTNPSPICVLDEVDAPLDDANVERYCDLLQDMARQTQTRFVVITHNPITMARMDRLFGVTMAERGVSQLVSVDLQRAEALAEAS